MKILTKICPDFQLEFKLISDELVDKSSLYHIELYFVATSKDSDDFDGTTTSKSLGICNTSVLVTDLNILKEHTFFYNNTIGKYLCFLNNVPKTTIGTYLKIKDHKGCGKFPYSTIEKGYAAQPFLNMFAESSKARGFKFNNNQLPYTFGLEFETSKGYIPEEICYQQGLIPLYDGSISGIEYSTIPLKGNAGISLLSEQLKTLKTYTEFDKECSLHIHFGNIPKDKYYAYFLYRVCVQLQMQLQGMYVPLAFESDKYKKTKKNYCGFLPESNSFRDFIYYMSDGQKNNIANCEENHPADREGTHKWQIRARYVWANFINLLFYRKNKTVEFRFLRPSYNDNQIINWIYLFSAILTYAGNIYSQFLELGIIKENLLYATDEVELILKSLLRNTLGKDIRKDINLLNTIITQVYGKDAPKIDLALKTFLEELVTQRELCIFENDLCGEFSFLREDLIFKSTIN